MDFKKLHIFARVLLCLFSFTLLSGCGGQTGNPDSGQDGSSVPPGSTQGSGSWDSTPKVLTPTADGSVTYGNETVAIDASNTRDGYIMASYIGSSSKVKLQIKGPDGVTYTYDMKPEIYDTFPLSAGSGSYDIGVYENISGDKYSTAFYQTIEVQLKDEFTPFLYPNQFVNYSKDTEAVTLARELSADADSGLDVVANIYHYVIDNIVYDDEKADAPPTGYLPDLDETLETKKGICFDYASLMTCMLRSQGIPTKLQIGFSGEIKHAWISTYLEETGWVDNIIEFDGKDWELMDPTFAANTGAGQLKKYIGDGSNYTLQYSR